MKTQKEIAKAIRNKKADYVLAVKKNQPTLYINIKDYFDTALIDKTGDFTAESVAEYNKGYDRIENRQYYDCEDISWLEQKKE